MQSLMFNVDVTKTFFKRVSFGGQREIRRGRSQHFTKAQLWLQLLRKDKVMNDKDSVHKDLL